MRVAVGMLVLLEGAAALSRPACGGITRPASPVARRAIAPVAVVADGTDSVVSAPSLTTAELDAARPSLAMEPRDVITTMMSALHRSNADTLRPYFGCEVALRFLSPDREPLRGASNPLRHVVSPGAVPN